MHVHSPHMHSHMDTHTTTNVWMECWGKLMPPTLLKKRAQFLYLTSRLNVFPKTSEEHMGCLSLFHVFIQPVLPEYPLCAGLMLSAVAGDTNWGSAQPPRSTLCFWAEEGPEPVIPVAKSQPGACRLRAGSQLQPLESSCLPSAGHPRILDLPAGSRSTGGPGLWQGPDPSPTYSQWKHQAGVSLRQAQPWAPACLPACHASGVLPCLSTARVFLVTGPSASPARPRSVGYRGPAQAVRGQTFYTSSTTGVPCQGEP